MRRIQLNRSRLTTSRLGFGTSRLHYSGARERERLLRTAVDLGIIHIDTAPLYGDTLAELEIGRVLRSERERLVIVSKYGVPPSSLLGALSAIAKPLRALRGVARKILPPGKRPRPTITGAGLRSSVEGSLRRMRTDRLDALLLHEPGPDTVVDHEEIAAEFQRLRERGLVKHFGLAGPWPPIMALWPKVQAWVEILQTSEADWSEDFPPDVSYGALSQGAQAFGAQSLSSDVAGDRLGAALRRRPEGVVLVSSTSAANLVSLAHIAELADQ
jgi:aryl-alcohol dehydrogenase-like predicted oxidoreductase